MSFPKTNIILFPLLIFLQIINFVSNLKSNYFKLFVFFLSILAIIRLFLLGAFNLVPQEAYYWLYIQHPALSYFDHPPMCSYTIGVFTSIFGNNEFGVRFGMLLYSIGTSLFLFLLARKFFNSEKEAFLSFVFLNLTIFFNLHSIVATPDAPLLFFWSGAMYFYFKAIFEGDRWVDWVVAGLFSGFALASKYTASFIVFNLVLFFLGFSGMETNFQSQVHCFNFCNIYSFYPSHNLEHSKWICFLSFSNIWKSKRSEKFGIELFLPTDCQPVV